MPHYPDSPVQARVARCCICRKVGNKYEVKSGHLETLMILIGYNKYETPPDEDRAIFRCVECEPGGERWMKYCKKHGYNIMPVWKKKSPTANQKSGVLQDKEKEIVRCVCKINKKGEAIFTSRTVKKEIERKFQSSTKTPLKARLVSTSTDGTSESLDTPTTTLSSASPVAKTVRVTTTPSASLVTSRAGKRSCKGSVSRKAKSSKTRPALTFASRRSSTFSKKSR
jgi:hypothetical protein